MTIHKKTDADLAKSQKEDIINKPDETKPETHPKVSDNPENFADFDPIKRHDNLPKTPTDNMIHTNTEKSSSAKRKQSGASIGDNSSKIYNNKNFKSNINNTLGCIPIRHQTFFKKK